MTNFLGDLLLTNVSAPTASSAAVDLDSILIRDGRIHALGKYRDLRPLTPSTVDDLDCAGTTVLPGFVDGHCHFEMTCTTEDAWIPVHTPPFESLAEIAHHLRHEIARDVHREEWILCRSSFSMHEKVKEQRLFTRQELDEICHDRPLAVFASLHVASLNTRALKALGLWESGAAHPELGVVHRDRHQEPTGVVTEAFLLVRSYGESECRVRLWSARSQVRSSANVVRILGVSRRLFVVNCSTVTGMAKRGDAVHVVRVRKSHVDKQGQHRDYESAYLRRTFREGTRVRNETVANLSTLPAHVIDWVEAGLKGQTLVPADTAATVLRSVPHGHVAAVWAQAKVLGLPAMLGPAGRQRDLAMALILARAVAPASKLATASWWADTTLGVDLEVTGAGTDEIYAAMDWLTGRQDHIEKQLAGKHLDPKVNPSRIAMFDLSSSWVTGRHCDLAARGYSRDGKKGCEQIEYGLLTDPAGRPVAVRVFPGNTADPAAFTHAVTAVKDTFALENMLMVGDRGMITSARITALKELGGLGWLTALRAPQIAALAADDGPLQMSLFDEQNFAEITHPDYPGERLIVCRNPALADERARKRGELLDATEAELGKIVAAVTAGRLSGAGKIGLRVGKVLGKYKVGKHFHLDIADTSLTVTRDRERIDAEAALDGIYTLRTTASADELGTAAVIDAYKNLSRVERDFRSLKAIDLDLRPIHHRLTDRVKAHVLICMLAAYLTWHLRQAWAPLTYTDEHPTHREDPVAPAARSAAANSKAARKTTTDGDLPTRSYQALMGHLATLTRNDLQYGEVGPIVATLAVPTPTQRRAFELLDTTIPLTVR